MTKLLMDLVGKYLVGFGKIPWWSLSFVLHWFYRYVTHYLYFVSSYDIWCAYDHFDVHIWGTYSVVGICGHRVTFFYKSIGLGLVTMPFIYQKVYNNVKNLDYFGNLFFIKLFPFIWCASVIYIYISCFLAILDTFKVD